MGQSNLNRHQALRAIGVLVGIWVGLLTVIFQEVPNSVISLSTKVQLAILATVVILFAFPVFFRWDWLRARSTLVIRTLVTVVALGLSLYMGYALDYTAYITWQWVTIDGTVVVTWLNVIGSALIIFSVFLYFWAASISVALVTDLRNAYTARRRNRRRRTP